MSERVQKVGTKIRRRTAGDTWTIRRRVTNLPTGHSIAEAWFYVKENFEDADSAALITKHLVGTTPDTGSEVEVVGPGPTIAVVRFKLLNTETVLLKPWVTYYYDFQVKTDQGDYDTPDDGTIIATPQVTQAL